MDDAALISAAKEAGLPLIETHMDAIRAFAQIVGDSAIEEYCADQDHHDADEN